MWQTRPKCSKQDGKFLPSRGLVPHTLGTQIFKLIPSRRSICRSVVQLEQFKRSDYVTITLCHRFRTLQNSRVSLYISERVIFESMSRKPMTCNWRQNSRLARATVNPKFWPKTTVFDVPRCYNIVAYLLKARTAEPEKQPMLCNDRERGGYTWAVSSGKE
jgi:hypothetical protein